MLHDSLLRAKGSLIFQDHAGVLGGGSPPAKLALHVTTLHINRQIAIIGMPREPFVEFEVGWRNRCPVRSCFFLVYTNGYLLLLPHHSRSLPGRIWRGRLGHVCRGGGA
jgi:hypothetical protein